MREIKITGNNVFVVLETFDIKRKITFQYFKQNDLTLWLHQQCASNYSVADPGFHVTEDVGLSTLYLKKIPMKSRKSWEGHSALVVR